MRSDPRLSAPDLGLLFAPVVFAGEGLERPPRHGFTIGVLALQPASRGGVALASADPLVAPVIRPNYLADPADLQVMAKGVELARRIAAASACRMGTDELSVVDPQLRVRGVEGLYVADASVLPRIVRGHTAAVVGERAADLMLRGREDATRWKRQVVRTEPR